MLQSHFKKKSLWRFFVQLFLAKVVFLALIGWWAEVQAVTIDELISKGKDYNGKKVEIEAEAIGHLMWRQKGAWLNVADASSAIGVWLERAQAKKINFLGNYNTVGDTIRISGTFNMCCKVHGGDADIHVEELQIIKSGHKIEHPFDERKLRIFLFLAGVTTCLFLIKILRRTPKEN